MDLHNGVYTLANKQETASPASLLAKAMLKTVHPSSPPPLIEDECSMIEDGETIELPNSGDVLRGKSYIAASALIADSVAAQLQLSTFEYSSLEDRFRKLQRQHGDLQDLASAYSEVIHGFSALNSTTVSINQLQVEAGREGLRAKALENDVVRLLVREAGGLQPLTSQVRTIRALIDKAGGPRELEQFVSDLHVIRDTLDELKGSQGLVDLVPVLRDLLVSKHTYAELQSELHGPNGLKARAAKYDKLVQTFTDVQGISSSQQPPICTTAMNPARAQMIAAMPVETDPDRDLYEAKAPVAMPNNKTGSNNTPLGVSQWQPALKRKRSESSASGALAKRPRIDLGRASALVQASSPALINESVTRASSHSKPIEDQAGAAVSKTRVQPNWIPSKCTLREPTGSPSSAQTAAAALKTPDWMRSNARFVEGDTRFPSYSSTPPTKDTQSCADARPGHVGLLPDTATQHPLLEMNQLGFGSHMALQPAMAAHLDPRYSQVSVWKVLKGFLKHAVAFWVGSSNASAAWDAYRSYELKKKSKIPDDLLMTLAEELARGIPAAKYSIYETIMPNHDTCILR